MSSLTQELPRWRKAEPDTFRNTILIAAEQLGVQPLAVEKDYWVCEALRAIAAAHPGEVVFKGGTSLEKLRIIRRFSEDLDLLVVGKYQSNNATKNALKSMCATAAEATGGAQSDVKSGGNPGGYHRRSYLAPPLTHASGRSGAIADASAVLLEFGQSGGPNPSRTSPVTSLLSRQLERADFNIHAYSDLTAFDVSILHPGRTLIEKLLRVNNFVSNPESAAHPHGWPRIGRQFYDIWALLGNSEVLELLADNDASSRILDSCFEVSRAFTPDHPMPLGGFTNSAAFDPQGTFAPRLRAEHNAAMTDLYYGTDDPPTFEDVIERVNQSADLLTIDPL